MIEDTTRSNIKISHPFFTELVDQTVQYMLSGQESFVKSDHADLQKELDQYFGDAFKNELAETLTDCCSGGFGYLYAYKGSNFRTTFTFANALNVIEVKSKDTQDNKDYIIYHYKERSQKDKKEVKYIGVWDEKQTTYFVQHENGKIERDHLAKTNPRPHIVYAQRGKVYGEKLGYIPFFRIDNNRKQFSDLKPIKPLIDDYDLMSCGLSNNLQDISEGIYVVKGFSGDNLDELIQNIKVKKHIGIEVDGDIDIRTVTIPYEARLVKLEVDEKNIYRFGMGFNSAQLGDGNITNIVIKSRYALLDLKCNKLEAKLKAFLKKLIAIAIKEINQKNKADYQVEDVYIVFKREVMTNAQDNATIEKMTAENQQIRLTSILNAASLLDEKTVLQEICNLFEIDFDTIEQALKNIPSINLNTASEGLLGGELQ